MSFRRVLLFSNNDYNNNNNTKKVIVQILSISSIGILTGSIGWWSQQQNQQQQQNHRDDDGKKTIYNNNNEHTLDQQLQDRGELLVRSYSRSNHHHHHHYRGKLFEPIILSNSIFEDSRRTRRYEHNKQQHNNIQEYDYIIIGYGNAGRNVVKTLRQYCPTASIAIIDPTNYCSTKSSESHHNNSSTTQHINESVIQFNPHERIVVITNNNNNNNNNNESVLLQYKHSICIATGAHCAPIPSYIIDDKIRQNSISMTHHIFELKSSSIVVSNNLSTEQQEQNNYNQPNNQQWKKTPNKKKLTPEEMRKQIIYNATQGYSIGILGSGWDAIELAVAAATTTLSTTLYPPTGRVRKNTKQNLSSNNNKKKNIQLVFGSYGPLSHTVPPYLSTAISKRLKAKSITVHDRSLIRYISYDANNINNNKQSGRINLYTAKSYDYMDGNRLSFQNIILAPECSGIRGNATIPTVVIPDDNDDNDITDASTTNSTMQTTNPYNNFNRAWYKTWSQLSSNTGPSNDNYDDYDDKDTTTPDDPYEAAAFACYQDDGRIAVNLELQACSGVYAAGSVAKFANSITGHAHVAGIGIVDATQAGYVAGRNMARTYYNDQQKKQPLQSLLNTTTNPTSSKSRYQNDNKIHLMHHIPVWRSDLLQYATPRRSNKDNNSNEEIFPESSLKQFGINALCVGNCDAEGLATHAVWWTNQAVQQRLLRMMENESNDESGSGETKTSSDSSTTSTKFTSAVRNKPIYGIGVIYYIDRKCGQIQGVMTWGIPYTVNSQSQKLNEKLVEKMKRVLTENGGFLGSVDNEFDYMRITDYFTDTGKDIVATAFSSTTTTSTSATNDNHSLLADHVSSTANNATIISASSLPRPLHRFSLAKDIGNRTASLMKRKDGLGQGVLGEHLFARSCYDEYNVESLTNNIITLTGNEVGAAGSDEAKAKIKALNEYNLYKLNEKKWDDNENCARPPKEDPLWIRRGDESRGISAKDSLNAAYHNLWQTG